MNENLNWLMEFHVSRQSRDYYGFDDPMFSYNGNVVFANFHAARVFAQKMNDRKNLVLFPEQAVRSSQVNAMGLIDEILHIMLEQYRRERNPNVMSSALSWLEAEVGTEQVEDTLHQFANEFPLTAIYRKDVDIDTYLAGFSTRPDGTVVSNRELLVEEMLMLWLGNMNPAYKPFNELFSDDRLQHQSQYPEIIVQLQSFFQTQPAFGADNLNLIDLLRSPALASPDSLSGQLEFIRARWGHILGSALLRLLSSLDLVKEEEKMYFGVGGPGPTEIYEFTGLEADIERFSPDKDWMPRLVLIAKNSFVWLDQLSKQYKRPITRLDQIPDEELDRLARYGFTGLWLIGLWERSQASKTIKQLRGNPEAVASAYSLMDYSIADDLGGEEAYRTLRDRAWRRGIRLASDMVPNHMGIDSRWLIEHPDWFVQLDYPPFPSYTFNGPNLSWDSRTGIYLEDHYYNNSDAAVVFKRVDFWSGSEKFIYHGNDGTSMPWNDTAQLNYLIPYVREAVIQTILHVARMFPVIRFDAAMTLAKKHYQRLWFPEPGHGGDIASRAEYGLTKEQFDVAFPEEFWREVVDRVAAEAPDTLLLAEAFWLMEGYFVRTLGMHRVYNSAFMNMLRDEKNKEYRQAIKNTIEFEPEILKRYVNFMNNPDERTAVDQYGKGDKYFGVLTMMMTLPGLPMFGHGQIEGYTEKYGMEYRRAYWDEQPDQTLVERHEKEVFPLLHKRYLFAESLDFLLYDFFVPEGHVDEDVYAYSNRRGEESALFIYNNKYQSTRGSIHISTRYPIKNGESGERQFFQKSIADGLGLSYLPGTFIIFRDVTSGLEYLRNTQEIFERGLQFELNGYEHHVYLDFRQVQDTPEGGYGRLASYLKGGGVENVAEALQELMLQPLHGYYREVVNPGWYQWVIDHRLKITEELTGDTSHEEQSAPDEVWLDDMLAILSEMDKKSLPMFKEIMQMTAEEGQPAQAAAMTRQELATLLNLTSQIERNASALGRKLPKGFLEYLETEPGQKSSLQDGNITTWGTLLSWVFNHRLSQAAHQDGTPEQCRSLMDEWLLGKIISKTLQGLGLEAWISKERVDLVKVLVGHQEWYIPPTGKLSAYEVVNTWLKDQTIQQWIKVNRYEGVLWYNKEAFEQLVWWMHTIAILQITSQASGSEVDKQVLLPTYKECYQLVQKILEAEECSGFQVEALLAGLE